MALGHLPVSNVVALFIRPSQEKLAKEGTLDLTLIDSRLNGDYSCHITCHGRGVAVVDYETSPSRRCPETRQPTLLHELVSWTWHTIDLT